MAQRVPWDMSEAVIMLNALIAAREGRMSRKDAIVAVSSKLRSRAKRNGIEVDDIFRNVNGITLQMSTMEYILTDGEKGMKKSSMPKLFQDAVAMYQNDRATYEKNAEGGKEHAGYQINTRPVFCMAGNTSISGTTVGIIYDIC